MSAMEMRRKDLIYDVGMHVGEDTEYYLKKGFRVIAFEANPDLANFCRAKFLYYINDGRLVIVEGAIVDAEYNLDTIDFYVNSKIVAWGTVSFLFAERNVSFGTENTVIKVRAINFAECLKTYGVPYYLKIDIEGLDTACLEALKSINGRPAYISMESEKQHFEKLVSELSLLSELGYDRFQAIDQTKVERQIVPFPPREGIYVTHVFQDGSSGLFGEELPGEWKSADHVLTEYKRIFFGYKIFGDYGLAQKYLPVKVLRKALRITLRRQIPGWYDTHAKHSSVRDQI